MSFEERLINARKAKGISQELLAEQLGISRQAVSKWETGESKPDLDNLTALCASLDISMEYLCFGNEQKKQKAKHTCLKILCVILPVAAIVLGLILGWLHGLHIGSANAHAEHEETVQDVQILSDMRIVEAKVSYDYDKKAYAVSVLPIVAPEGMKVELLVTSVTGMTGDSLAIKVPCTYEEGYFRAYLKEGLKRNHGYMITAVLQWGDMKAQIPVMYAETYNDDASFGQVPLWEQRYYDEIA